jgi:hypothetical protein
MNGMALNSQDRKDHTARRNRVAGGSCLFASALLLLCSCATTPPPSAVTGRPELPPTVTMNADAGRGGHLIISLRLESGEELPFMVDTGSPMTILDKALEPKLGKCLATGTFRNVGTEYKAGRYATPKLYLGRTPLLTGSSVLASDYVEKMSSVTGHPLTGVLGMDCLQHYCLQLDFQAGKIRFLDSAHMKPAKLGQVFPLTLSRTHQNNAEWVHPYIRHTSLVGGQDTNVLIDTGANADSYLEPGLFQREIREQRMRGNVDTIAGQEPDILWLPQCIWNGGTYTDLAVGNGAALLGGRGGNSLGLRFLARHLVTFDFPHRTLYLKQTRTGPSVPDEVRAEARAAIDSAVPHARKLMRNNQLPGWSEHDRGTIKGASHYRHNPDRVTVDALKKGDSSTYHYVFTRASKESLWQLQKAWRTDQNDHTVEEYPVP